MIVGGVVWEMLDWLCEKIPPDSIGTTTTTTRAAASPLTIPPLSLLVCVYVIDLHPPCIPLFARVCVYVIDLHPPCILGGDAAFEHTCRVTSEALGLFRDIWLSTTVYLSEVRMTPTHTISYVTT